MCTIAFECSPNFIPLRFAGMLLLLLKQFKLVQLLKSNVSTQFSSDYISDQWYSEMSGCQGGTSGRVLNKKTYLKRPEVVHDFLSCLRSIAWLGTAQNFVVLVGVQTLCKIVHKEAKMYTFCLKLKLLGLIRYRPHQF